MCADAALSAELAKSFPLTIEEAKEMFLRGEYGRLLDHTRRLIFRLCKSFYRDPDRRNDAIQDCCLILWRVMHKYDPSRSAWTSFAAAVVRNSLVTMRKRDNLQRVVRSVQVEEFTQSDPKAESPVREIERREEWDRVSAAIESLPVHLREVMHYRANEMCFEEISRQVGISRQGVCRRADRAIQEVRSRLGVLV